MYTLPLSCVVDLLGQYRYIPEVIICSKVWGGLYDCLYLRVLCFSVCGHVLCAGPVASMGWADMTVCLCLRVCFSVCGDVLCAGPVAGMGWAV